MEYIPKSSLQVRFCCMERDNCGGWWARRTHGQVDVSFQIGTTRNSTNHGHGTVLGSQDGLEASGCTAQNAVSGRAEKRTAHDELGPHNKLGDLWTWATSHTASRGKFVVIPAQIILQTVPMMPKWREQTHGWSVQTGVFQNSYLLDPRLRPPFTACQCGKWQNSWYLIMVLIPK